MPCRATHLPVGVVAGPLALWLISRATGIRFNPEDYLFAAGASGAGGILPDIIEPATSPNHRKVAHSKDLIITLVGGELAFNRVVSAVKWAEGLEAKVKAGLCALVLDEKEQVSKPKCIGLALVIGYLSHLALDAFTPKGLPGYLVR